MSQELEAPIQQERAETATLTHNEPTNPNSVNANATTDVPLQAVSNSQTILQPMVDSSKQLPTTVTTEPTNPITQPPPPSSSSDLNDDEQLYRFLTHLTTVKPTVPPTVTRRIMQKQGVGFVDPLVPKLISSCGDKFIATILSQAIICRDRRVKGEIMKRKYEREMVRILKRRKIQDMDREKDLKKEEEALEEFIKNMKKGSLDDASLEKKKKKTGVHFTFDSKKGLYPGEEGEDNDDDDDDLKKEEEYYASQMKAILGVDGTTPLEMTDIHLDGKKQYLEDESDDEDDDEDEDNERDMIQLVDVFRPLQAWGMSLVGKMGLSSDPVIQTRTKKNESDDEEENVSDDENAGDLEEEEEDTDAIEGDEKTPARKKKKTAVAGETGSTKRRRSVTPKPKSSPSSSGPAVKKSKIAHENVGADAPTGS